MNQNATLDHDTIALKGGSTVPVPVAVTGSAIICKEANGRFEVSVNNGRSYFPLEVGLSYENWANRDGKPYLETFTKILFRNPGQTDLQIEYYWGSGANIKDARLNTALYRQTVPVQNAPIFGPLAGELLLHPGEKDKFEGIFSLPSGNTPVPWRRKEITITNLSGTDLTLCNFIPEGQLGAGTYPWGIVKANTEKRMEGDFDFWVKNDSGADIHIYAASIYYKS